MKVIRKKTGYLKKEIEMDGKVNTQGQELWKVDQTSGT